MLQPSIKQRWILISPNVGSGYMIWENFKNGKPKFAFEPPDTFLLQGYCKWPGTQITIFQFTESLLPIFARPITQKLSEFTNDSVMLTYVCNILFLSIIYLSELEKPKSSNMPREGKGTRKPATKVPAAQWKPGEMLVLHVKRPKDLVAKDMDKAEALYC